MQVKGYILFVLLIMLLFVSVALLQLNEDNYLSHLVNKHVENSSNARKVLKEGFSKLSTSLISSACYNDALICQTKISGITVKYALLEYQQEDQEQSYLQYTLETRVGMSSVALTVVVDQESGYKVSWNYH